VSQHRAYASCDTALAGPLRPPSLVPCCNNEQCCCSPSGAYRDAVITGNFKEHIRASTILLIPLPARSRPAHPEGGVSDVVPNSRLIKKLFVQGVSENFAIQQDASPSEILNAAFILHSTPSEHFRPFCPTFRFSVIVLAVWYLQNFLRSAEP